MHHRKKFKDNEILLKFLFKTMRRNRKDYYDFSVAEQMDTSRIGVLLWEALQQLNEEEQRIIIEEFLRHKKGDWWIYYYSRATYYRLKANAMTKMLDYLHKGRII